MASSSSSTRAALVDALKHTRARGAEAWLNLLRHDYAVALTHSSLTGFKKLLQSYRTAVAQVGTDQRRLPVFVDLLVDEACAHIHVDANAARQSFKAIRTLPSARGHARFWRTYAVFEARQGDVEASRRALDGGVASSDVPEAERDGLRVLQRLLDRGPDGVTEVCRMNIEPVDVTPVTQVAGADDDVISFRAVRPSTLPAQATSSGAAAPSAPEAALTEGRSAPPSSNTNDASSRSLVRRFGGAVRVGAAGPSAATADASVAPPVSSAAEPKPTLPVAMPDERAETVRVRRRTTMLGPSTAFVSALSPVAEDRADTPASRHGARGADTSSLASTRHGVSLHTTSSTSDESSMDASSATASMDSSLATTQTALTAVPCGALAAGTSANGICVTVAGGTKRHRVASSFELPDYIKNFTAAPPARGRSQKPGAQTSTSTHALSATGGDSDPTANRATTADAPATVSQDTASTAALAADLQLPVPQSSAELPASAAPLDDSVVIFRTSIAARKASDAPAATAATARNAVQRRPMAPAPADVSTSFSEDDDSFDGPTQQMAAPEDAAAPVRYGQVSVECPTIPRVSSASRLSDQHAAGASPGGSPFDALTTRHEVLRVGGRAYLRLECIGKGGSSKVYRVLGDDLRTYALKRVKLMRTDPTTLSSYTNEIALLRRLNGCRHVIRLVDAEINYESKLVQLVMEYGQIDLNRLLQDEAVAATKGGGATLDWCRLDPNMLRLVWQQMLVAVHTIHEARIVHGDLKPANFVFVEGVLKLIDFGIAKAISNDTTNIVRDSQVGTVNYMSPEAITDVSGSAAVHGRKPMLKLGRASDIWSLGCILYQMVHGNTPFAHLSLIQKLHAICDPSFEIHFPAIPDHDLDAVLKACLQRDPGKRPGIGGPEGLLRHPFLQPHLGRQHVSTIPAALSAAVAVHRITEVAADADPRRLVRALETLDAAMGGVTTAADVDRALADSFAAGRRDAVPLRVLHSDAVAGTRASARPPPIPSSRSPAGRSASQPPAPRLRLAPSGTALQEAILAQASALRKVTPPADKENVAAKSSAPPTGLEAALRKGLSERFAHVALQAPMDMNVSGAVDMDMTWTSAA